MITVDTLTKRFGATAAVDGISFEVARDEIVGLLGPNGAGKTTTMRILTCYMPATSGTASVGGYDVFKDSIEVRKRIGYLPEGVPLYPEMRVSEYLAMRARIKLVPPKERRNRIEYVMDRCGVADVRRKLIGSLSKGYRQRVGLADALIHDPPVLILDEPTIGLDPNQIRQVRQLIRDLGRDHTILLSTHILTEVEMVCKRVIIIARGRIAFQETLENIARRGTGEGRVVLEASGVDEHALSILRDIPGITRARSDGGRPFARFDMLVKSDCDVREEIFRRAVRNNWIVRELRREVTSLEDIFVRLTAKEEE